MKKARIVLAILVLLLAVGVPITMYGLRVKESSADAVEMKDGLLEALKMKQEQSKSGLQVALGILAVLWATVLVKPGDVTFEFKDWPPVVMFAASNALLFGSAYFHSQYVEVTANQLWDVIKQGLTVYPDIMNSYINNAYFNQWVLLATGGFCSGLHLLVVYKLPS